MADRRFRLAGGDGSVRGHRGLDGDPFAADPRTTGFGWKFIQSKSKAREALREAMAHRGYLFMTLAFFACGFQLVFITTHLPAYLQLCGVAPAWRRARSG